MLIGERSAWFTLTEIFAGEYRKGKANDCYEAGFRT